MYSTVTVRIRKVRKQKHDLCLLKCLLITLLVYLLTSLLFLHLIYNFSDFY